MLRWIRHLVRAAVAVAVSLVVSMSLVLMTDEALLLATRAEFLVLAGKSAEAEELLKQAVAKSEKTWGPDHSVTAQHLHDLALHYQNQAKYAEAEPLYKRSLAIREKVLSPDHADIGWSLNNLALLYQNQAKYAEAEPLYKRSLAIRETSVGPDHPDVGASLNNLAELYRTQGRYDDAESLYKRSLAIHETALGPDHPDVGVSLNNLANLYQAQGRYADAEPLYKRSLTLREKALGTDHPDVGASLNNLAMLYQTQGRYADAEPLFKRARGILETALGPDHPDVAQSLNNLAALYQTLGRYAEAEPLNKRALAIRETALGPEHPDNVELINQLAAHYQVVGRAIDAEELYKRAVRIREKALGPDHRDVGASLNNLAGFYATEDRFAEAEPLFRRAITILETALGTEDVDVARAISNLAEYYKLQGRYADAEPIYKRALAVLEKAVGSDHLDVGQLLMRFGGNYQLQDRFAEAEPLYERALGIIGKAAGPDHPTFAFTLHNMAALYRELGQPEKAESLARRALDILESKLGPQHPDVGTSLAGLAALHLIKGDVAKAEKEFMRALAIKENALESDRLDIAGSLYDLGLLHYSESRWGTAVEFLERGTNVLIGRAQHGAKLGTAITGKGKSELVRAHEVFATLVRAYHRWAKTGEGRWPYATDKAFAAAQRPSASEAALSLVQMSVRQAKGDTKQARIVRERQDLVAEWQAQEKALAVAVSELPEKRLVEAEQSRRKRLSEIEVRIAEIDKSLEELFPDYAALVSQDPLSIADTQAHLRDDEALVLFLDVEELEPSRGFRVAPEETFIWVLTKTEARWVRTDLGTKALRERVTALRCGLDATAWGDDSGGRCAALLGLDPETTWRRGQQLPFKLALAHELYKELFGEIEDLIKDKHLLLVPSGALTALPFQVLVSEAPSPSTQFADVAWLAKRHTLTVLPSVSSLAALRRNPKGSAAPEPFIAFANPVLARNCRSMPIPDRCPDEGLQVAVADGDTTRSAGEVDVTNSYFRNGLADTALLKSRLCPLPDTAFEVACVAKSLGADAKSLVLGKDMTETALKKMKLDQYRVVHFATHGLLAGETAQLARERAEPALVMTPPDTPAEEDDGLLTASEVSALKLDADWVVMSACNTAAGAEPGAEALSGLAKAFFYSGARALLVSHWPVNSYAATILTSRTFAEIKKDGSIGRSEAFRRAMLALMSDEKRSWAAHPSVWAPFVVVGEGGVSR